MPQDFTIFFFKELIVCAKLNMRHPQISEIATGDICGRSVKKQRKPKEFEIHFWGGGPFNNFSI